jgi:hypothetical protein
MSVVIQDKKLFGEIDKILKKASIAYRVSNVKPIQSPNGVIVGSQRDPITDKFKVASEAVQAQTETLSTEFTQEALQDIEVSYGEDIYDFLAHYLIDDLMYKIDSRFITMIKDRAKQLPKLHFPSIEFADNPHAIARIIAFSINKALADFPISDNRPAKGFAVVNSDIGTLMSVSLEFKNNTNDDSPSYLGEIAGVDYYIDYTHDNTLTDAILLGIKGNNAHRGSTFLAPYTREFIEAQDYTSGDFVYHLYDRTAMCINPIDEEDYYKSGAGDSGFLGKMDVDLDDMLDYYLLDSTPNS